MNVIYCINRLLYKGLTWYQKVFVIFLICNLTKRWTVNLVNRIQEIFYFEFKVRKAEPHTSRKRGVLSFWNGSAIDGFPVIWDKITSSHWALPHTKIVPLASPYLTLYSWTPLRDFFRISPPPFHNPQAKLMKSQFENRKQWRGYFWKMCYQLVYVCGLGERKWIKSGKKFVYSGIRCNLDKFL